MHSHNVNGAAVAFVGQATAVQLPPKYGLLEDTEMVPLKPALHVHPASTLVPLLFNGHATEEQLTNGR